MSCPYQRKDGIFNFRLVSVLGLPVQYDLGKALPPRTKSFYRRSKGEWINRCDVDGKGDPWFYVRNTANVIVRDWRYRSASNISQVSE